MSDVAEQLKRRTMRFALDARALIRELPQFEPGPTVQRQLAKAATGVAFNAIMSASYGTAREKEQQQKKSRRRR
jgi:hypothetical protein